MKGRFYFFKLADGQHHRKRQDTQHAQRQLGIDCKNHYQGKAEIQDIFKDGRYDISHKVTDGIHITRLAAHKVTGAVTVIEGKILH